MHKPLRLILRFKRRNGFIVWEEVCFSRQPNYIAASSMPREGEKDDTWKMVGAEGFEPTTPASQTLCATRLRYAPLPCSIAESSLLVKRSKEWLCMCYSVSLVRLQSAF